MDIGGALIGWLNILIGFAIGLLAEPLKRRLWGAKLQLTFGTTGAYHTTTPIGDPNGDETAIFVRIRVVNVGRGLAKSCRAYLVKLERKSDWQNPGDHRFEETDYAESLQLAWSSQDEEARFGGLDLPKDVPHFVDVFMARSPWVSFSPVVKVTPRRYAQLLGTQGIYRFTIVVSGDGVEPATIQVVAPSTGVRAMTSGTFED